MEDIDEALNYDNPDFMTSEFFDSVLSLENNMDESFLSNFEDDINLSSDDMNIFSDASSHMEEVLSPQSLNSESDKNSSTVESVDESVISNADVLEPLGDPFILSLLKPSNFECNQEPYAKPTLIDKNVTAIQQTRILIQNPNNKKMIAKPMLTTSPQKQMSVKAKPHILKVQPLSSNGNPVLLPLNMKSIKILNTPANLAALSSNLKRRKINTQVDLGNNIVTSTSPYPPLMLTQEEKRLLAKEGIQLPTHHPLTKNEERELKRIRRKIRNKISAQDSRKRKKEYVDGLEERVKRGSEENKNLLQRVRALQRQNKTLIAHVNKLQALIRNSTSSKATPSTCLMVVLLSALLVSLPNIKMFENKQMSTEQEQVAIRRSLLSSQQATEDNNLNLDEFLIFNEDKGKFDEEMFDIDNSTEKEFNRMIEDMEKEYESLLSNNNKSKMGIFGKVFETFKHFIIKEKPDLFGSVDYGGYNSKNVFIEPDIDEYIINESPPLKRSKFTAEENSNSFKNNEQVILTTVNTQIPSKTK